MSVVRGAAGLAVGALLVSGCSTLDGLQHQATLTFRIDPVQCTPSTAAGTVCSFFAYYGNVGSHAVQVEPSTTVVVDRTGRTFAPKAEAQTGEAFLLKPGAQHAISWSVTLPTNAKPARVTWHGSKASVQLDSVGLAPVPSAGPSASAQPNASAGPSASASVPATTPAPTTPAPTTTAPTTTPAPTSTKATVKPTKTKPTVKPTKTTVTPTRTTVPPTTPAPPTTPQPTHTTTRPPVHRTTAPPTTNSTNPGGGSGGIG